MSDMAIELPIRPITVSEYHRMAAAGIIEDDERIELLDGMLVFMPPIGDTHMFAHARIVRYLIVKFGTTVIVAGQASIPLTKTDEPQPDVSLFWPDIVKKPQASRTSADIVALFELSDSSLRHDTGPKLRAYGRGRVDEYLVVDLARRRVMRYRDPRDLAFDTAEEFLPGQSFTLLKLPGIVLDVAEFFGD